MKRSEHSPRVVYKSSDVYTIVPVQLPNGETARGWLRETRISLIAVGDGDTPRIKQDDRLS